MLPTAAVLIVLSCRIPVGRGCGGVKHGCVTRGNFAIGIAHPRSAATALLGSTVGIRSWCCFMRPSSYSFCGISTTNNPLAISMMLTRPLSRPLPTMCPSLLYIVHTSMFRLLKGWAVWGWCLPWCCCCWWRSIWLVFLLLLTPNHNGRDFICEC